MYHPRAAARIPEFIISGLKIAARANFKSLVSPRLHRIEGSRTEFFITSLRVPCTRVYEKCAEIPARAPSKIGGNHFNIVPVSVYLMPISRYSCSELLNFQLVLGDR